MQTNIATIRDALPIAWTVQIGTVRQGAAQPHRCGEYMNQSSGNALTDPTPEHLIARIARSQDKIAFSTLFDAYAPRVKYFLIRNGASSESAEELAQEALLTVWRKAQYFSADRGTASAWIFTIARNLRIDETRRDKRAQLYAMVSEFDDIDPDRPDELVSATEHAKRVRSAMSELPDDQLEVVKWSFVEGAAHSDIAERLGLPLGTVKSRLRLAMRRMRKSLEDLA
jgi:RNA polymerase sigma-70 factor (ECF subfamily)